MAKVRIDLKRVKRKINKFRDKAAPVVAEVLKKEVVGSIERGVSPVNRGGVRYKKYSDSYRNQIKSGRFSGKRVSPVNLKLTGELLASFFVKINRKSITVGFDNRLADIHNRRGAGKSKVIRRMLPTNKGETFSRSIILRIEDALKDIKKTFFR